MWCNLGFTTFDVGMDFADKVKCPMCKQTPSEKAYTVHFGDCRYRYKGRRADGTKREGGSHDTGAGGRAQLPQELCVSSGGWRALEMAADPRR
eukprot:SAG11_NODE_4278_length_1970_cov_3.899519_1_plen_93_part_00